MILSLRFCAFWTQNDHGPETVMHSWLIDRKTSEAALRILLPDLYLLIFDRSTRHFRNIYLIIFTDRRRSCQKMHSHFCVFSTSSLKLKGTNTLYKKCKQTLSPLEWQRRPYHFLLGSLIIHPFEWLLFFPFWNAVHWYWLQVFNCLFQFWL